MDETGSKKPWWRKMRWLLTAAVWLVFVYFFAYGAGAYGVGRGWITPGDHLAYKAFAPIGWAAELTGLEERNADFIGWCLRLGDADRAPGTPSIFQGPRAGVGHRGR